MLKLEFKIILPTVLWFSLNALVCWSDDPSEFTIDYIPRPVDFFPVNEDLAKQLSTIANVSVPAGLYYSPVRPQFLSAALRTPRFQKVSSYAANYLFQDAELEHLFEDKQWRYVGAKQIRFPSGKPVEISPFDENQLTIGWSSSPKGQQDLWLKRPNGEAWHILSTTPSGHELNLFLGAIPDHILLFKKGAVSITQDGQVHWKPFQGSSTSTFTLVDFTNTHPQQALKTVKSKPESTSWLVHRHPSLNRLLMVVPSSRHESFFDIVCLDLDSLKSTTLQKNIRQPIALSDSTIRYRFGTKEAERRLPADWLSQEHGLRTLLQKSEAATSDSTENSNPIPPTMVPAALLQQMGEELEATDLLNQLRTGVVQPLYASSDLDMRLMAILGRPSQNTLVLLPYLDGALPLEPIASFVQSMDSYAYDVPIPLRTLNHVFVVPPGQWLEADKLSKSLEILRKVAEHPGVIIVLEDFPVQWSKTKLTTSEAFTTTLTNRITALNTVIGPLSSQGKARVIVTVRQEVMDMVTDTHAHLLSDFAVAQIPNLSIPMRRMLTENVTSQIETTNPTVSMAPEAYDEARTYLDELWIPQQNEKAAPGLTKTFLNDLYSFASQQQKDPTSPFLIQRDFVRQFIQTTYRNWTLKSVTDPTSERNKILVWAKPLEQPALVSQRIIDMWRDSNSTLYFREDLPFAAITLPISDTSSVVSKQGVIPGQTFIFQPNSPTELQALSFVPIQLSLHRNGFFFVYSDSKEVSLCTFNRHSTSPVTVIRSAIHPDDLKEGKIKISFDKEFVTVTTHDSKLAFNSMGVEVLSP